MNKILPFLLISTFIGACTHQNLTKESDTTAQAGTSTVEFLQVSYVMWEQLNPARGKSSPLAGTLWGERTGLGPAGFLLKPIDGFKSPPHIHNVAYRGIVISGGIHNDDPNADDMYMPQRSFWTQPAGGIHITAAKGVESLAYIEIEDNFTVLPVAKAFVSRENPVNIHASNIVWVDPRGNESNDKRVKIAYLWQNHETPALNGQLVKLPKGFGGYLKGTEETMRVVVIEGNLAYRTKDNQGLISLEAGSYLGLSGNANPYLECSITDECVVYVRAQGVFRITSG